MIERIGRWKGLALGLVLGLTACANEPASAPPPPKAADLAPPPRSEAPGPSADMCGAAVAQAYVGQPRSSIPVPVEPALQRVACTTCPVTMDFVPRRLNFFYDAETGVVKEVRCG